MISKRKNIVQPSDWWAAFEKQAKREKMTLSAWIGKACKNALPAGCGLSDRPAAHRPKNAKQD